MEEFDFVIVGAGAAGSIVAYRLGEAGYCPMTFSKPVRATAAPISRFPPAS